MSISMKWAMICSIEDNPSYEGRLRQFGEWLTSSLQKEAVKLGLTHRFDEHPELVLFTNPRSYRSTSDAYSCIHTKRPDIIFIIHILPEPDSPVYLWMKILSLQFAFICQGVLLSNCLSLFENYDLPVVYGNILQWISRRMSQLVSKDIRQRVFNIRVGPSDNPTIPSNLFKSCNLTATVQTAFRSATFAEQSVSTSSVKVTGFPMSFNQYHLATLFASYTISAVFMRSEFAIIDFFNKYHAVQAAFEFNSKQLDAYHTLSVVPLHEETLKQLNVN